MSRSATSQEPSARRKLSAMAAIVLFCALLPVLLTPGTAHAVTRATDVTAPSDGNLLVKVPGTFVHEEKDDLLAKVNKIRKEACEQGVPDPRSPSRKLKGSDYAPIKWSAGLEEVAQTRAAEASVYQKHKRPNGQSCFEIGYDASSTGESLAWNPGAAIAGGIDQWYEEKSAWVKRDSKTETGHYTMLIDPDNTHIGLGGFVPEKTTSTRGAVACELGSGDGPDEAQSGHRGSCDQVIEVRAEKVKFKAKDLTMKVGTTVDLAVAGTLSMPDYWGKTMKTGVYHHGSADWASSDTCTVHVSPEGRATGLQAGSATLSVRLGTQDLVMSMTVVDPATVTVVTVNAAKVTKAAIAKAVAQAHGDTAIVQSVVIGKKAKSIAKGAFSECPNVWAIQVESKKLAAKSVKGSLSGSKVRHVWVEVGSAKADKKYAKKYKKAFAKKNSGKKVKVVAA